MNTNDQTTDTYFQSSEIKHLSIKEAFIIQLMPGVASAIIYAAVAYFLKGTGLPVLFALGAAIIFGGVPMSWFLIISLTIKENGGKFTFSTAFPWRLKIPIWFYVAIGIPAIILSTAILMAIFTPLSDILQQSLFSWVPSWLLMSFANIEISDVPQSVWIAMWIMSIFVMALIGGTTQELLSRGFILPRLSHMGKYQAPIINATFFAMLHIWEPWNWFNFFLASLLWSALVWKTRSVKIGIFIHVGMLLTQSIGMGFLIFS